MRTVRSEQVEEFVDHLARRDAAGAVELAVGLADEGVPIAEILTGLIAPAQAEIGERWHRNEISVADEHAATSITDATLSVLTATRQTPARGRHVAVGCVEGEWHVFPARLLAESLRFEGIGVSFLGASLPGAHLGSFLEANGPDAVALSCTTPLNFRGLLAAVRVAHGCGVPVIAGGRGLGPDARRAEALGADLWAATGPEAAQILLEPLPAVVRDPSCDEAAADALGADRPGLVQSMMDELVSASPVVAGFNATQLLRTREDLDYIIQFVEASLLVRDPRVFGEFTDWLRPLLAARSVPKLATEHSFDLLLRALGGHRAAASIVEAAQRQQ